jgi:carboxyl-terminal processing protease
VLHKVEENYVDPVQASDLVEGSLKGMLRQLDPYSQYLDPKAYTHLKDVTHGSFSGIGVMVGIREGFPTVISPIEGSPAWRAGLMSGDVIVRIDGKSSAGMSVEDAAQLLRGPEGTKVGVAVRREGEEGERDFELVRREIVTRSVPYTFVLENGLGYLRLANFSEASGAEVKTALSRLHQEGAKSLVLDLRMNPGGLLDQAVDVAEQFLPRGTLVVYTRGRARAQDNRYYASEERPEVRWPMVVLVDEGSASASEVVAGALQDRDRALVVGRTSFGKGSVQSVFPMRGRTAALKLTTALYYTPSGRSIHRRQRQIDLLAEESDEFTGEEEPDTASAAADTASRPVFETASGRRVYGGGGITPDVAVVPDSLPPFAGGVERRGLAFRFANRWLNAHPQAGSSLQPGEAMWKDFAEFLRAEKVTYTEKEWLGQRTVLELALRREMARRAGGDSAAVRVALEGDPVFQHAREVLVRARSPKEVFAMSPPRARGDRVEAPPAGQTAKRRPPSPAAPAPHGGERSPRATGPPPVGCEWD